MIRSSVLPDAWLFFKRYLANPKTVASVVPSSRSLARAMARFVQRGPEEIVVEAGAGTGAVTRALLDAGVPPEKLFVFEIDPDFARHLRVRFPHVHVIEADARQLNDHLPEEYRGKVGTVVCSLPLMLVDEETEAQLADAFLSAMPEGRRFLAYTYGLHAPVRRGRLGLEGERLGFTAANLPPAHVWGFRRAKRP